MAPRGIALHAVAPGWVRTGMNAAIRENAGRVHAIEADTAPGRFGETAGIAFLAADAGRWVTARVIEASGGHRL